MKTAGALILYNPSPDLMQNIESYIQQVDKLFVVDNSDREHHYCDTLLRLKKISYTDNQGNLGIAKALNIAAQKALDEGFDLLLTMDQDSSISADLVEKGRNEFLKDSSIGIIAPYMVHSQNPIYPTNDNLIPITAAMTSGSLINLTLLKKIGWFLEKLFIDYVDNELCLRMKSSGYKVMQLNSVYVFHNLGNVVPRKLIFKKLHPTNHSPLRWYYRTRNRLYFYKIYGKKFKKYMRFDKSVFLKDFIKILLFEKYKIEKINMIIKGYYDFKKNKFGKFEA